MFTGQEIGAIMWYWIIPAIQESHVSGLPKAE